MRGSRVTPSGCGRRSRGGQSADEWAHHFHQRLSNSRQDLLLSDPGPRDMFDDRVYKRGALTLHALRRIIGDDNFFALLRDWTTRYRHSTAVTDDFTGLAANYCGRFAAAAVGCVAVLRRTCRRCDRRGHAHRARSPAAASHASAPPPC